MGKAGSKRLEFSTIFNVRDLCGYQTPAGPVQSHRFLRSGDTMFLSDEDREALIAYGVHRVVDLRMAIERPELSDRMANADGVLWMNAHVADGRTLRPKQMQAGPISDLVVAGYKRMLAHKDGLRTLMEFMADAKPDECVLFHCAAGMDRTGVVSMLILGAAGVMRDDIVADYAYSFGNDREVDELIATWGPTLPPCSHDGLKARIRAMYDLLDWIEHSYSSVQGLLRDCGVRQHAIDALVAHAVE